MTCLHRVTFNLIFYSASSFVLYSWSWAGTRSKDNMSSRHRKNSKKRTSGGKSGTKGGKRISDKLKRKRRKYKEEKGHERDNKSASASLRPIEEQRKGKDGDKIVIEGVIYTRGKKIGRGGSGSVWQITREVDGTKFALKEASLRRNGAVYRGEVDRLQALKDAPHIITLIAQFVLFPLS
ncbi:hypothetical protein Y032_0302g1872 [Ancylostoma ceylanicum]|uniref:Protein kinase domain-containing protein n=1 Tax=Ancylostoma ceylanicum TaxID=53326 RepID=A0A016S4G6_9BILA|nr:hypothetical protein Y032_0302g1872 [Ancylostoma ceylanicum]